MGVVHRGLDTRLNRPVAIKVLLTSMAANPHARERLRREALSAASLDHPYVCTIFEISEDDGVLFPVMHTEKMSVGEVLRVGTGGGRSARGGRMDAAVSTAISSPSTSCSAHRACRDCYLI